MQIHVKEKTSSITKRLKEKRESVNKSFMVDSEYDPTWIDGVVICISGQENNGGNKNGNK